MSCRHSGPQAIRAFLESTDYESAVRLAVSLGGDSDTLACMAGGIAQAFYGGVPEVIAVQAYARRDAPLGRITREFGASFRCH